ncbi:MAG TPA: hypothetical protein VNS32_08010 [Flavisolibacter sp.]|nr:hypothetical protein [Flavisolibacter sp.]
MEQCTIFWADDDPDDVEMFQEILSNLGAFDQQSSHIKDLQAGTRKT